VATGAQAPHHWAKEGSGVDVWYLKGLLERVLPATRLDGGTLNVGQEGQPPFEASPEGSFSVAGSGGSVGHGGKIAAAAVDSPAWAGPVWAIEMTLPTEPGPRPATLYEPLPPFPGVDRDLALLVPHDLPSARVEETIRDVAGPLLVELAVFDLYEGEGVPAGSRSLAYRLRFQSPERTLTDKVVDKAVKKVTKRLREELGVEPRG